jgi:predicted lipid-binding transport protein (Tim44 family)
MIAYGYQGKTTWADTALIVGSTLFAFGLIFGVFWLVRLPARRRYRERIEAAHAAAATAPGYSVAEITAATQALFTRFLPAWTAGDLAALEPLADPSLYDDWSTTILTNRPRMRPGPLFRGPDVELVGLVLDPGREYATVRVRARVGNRWAYQSYDEFWTVVHQTDRWIITTIRNA